MKVERYLKVREKIENAIAKKAVGYDYTEEVEEFSMQDDAFVVSKKKVTKKHSPPDMQAAKLLAEWNGEQKQAVAELSEEELLKERDRLLALLKEKKEEKS